MDAVGEEDGFTLGLVLVRQGANAQTDLAVVGGDQVGDLERQHVLECGQAGSEFMPEVPAAVTQAGVGAGLRPVLGGVERGVRRSDAALKGSMSLPRVVPAGRPDEVARPTVRQVAETLQDMIDLIADVLRMPGDGHFWTAGDRVVAGALGLSIGLDGDRRHGLVGILVSTGLDRVAAGVGRQQET